VKLAVFAALALALLVPSSGAPLPPGPAHLTMTAKRELTEHPLPTNFTSTYALYARGYDGKIGTEVITCGSRKRWKICLVFIRTPRGTLTAQGLVPLASRFLILGVLGGTGIYSNAGGTVTIEMQNDGHEQRITGNLQGF
jgi:hypothetical protein